MKKKTPHKSYRTGMTDRVRQAAKVLAGSNDFFSRQDVFNHAEILLSERKSFKRTWGELRKRGEIVRIGHAQYRYDPVPILRGDVRTRIYRAMHVKGAFCAPDIAKLTEADLSYVCAIIRRLVKAGDLEFTGRLYGYKFYRVRNSEKFYLDRVRK